MSLQLGQLVYTSFPDIGFKLIASQQVPQQLQQVFMQLVYQHWDAYNPPSFDYRAAYLYQFSSEQCLFGWLYNNGMDDFGRSHIPYFLCYYLADPLHADHLNSIFTCLQKGPVAIIDRQPSSSPLMLSVSPANYQPARPGVAIIPQIQRQCHQSLEQNELLNLFVPLDTAAKSGETQEQSDARRSLTPPSTIKKTMTTGKIDEIIKELSAKPIGIQGAVLVSAEGQPVTVPIGMDENSALVMAGMMLYLASSTCEEFNWQKIDNISIRGQEGYVILTCCTEDVFLLVKTGKGLVGLLEGEINRTVKKLQVYFSDDGDASQEALRLNAEVIADETDFGHRGRRNSF
ncbi:MAG: roadblock/LC7 domain-containing protein [Cyanophyceae cyanobacterium]